MFSAKLTTFFWTFLLGALVAFIVYIQFGSKRIDKAITDNRVVKKIAVKSNTNTNELIRLLHSRHSIEYLAKNPAEAKKQKKFKENLTSEDRSALEQLIEKVAE